MSGTTGEELRSLIERTCTGDLTGPEAERLSSILRDSPEARRTYLDYLSLHASLAWELGPRSELPRRRNLRIPPAAVPLAAAALMIGVLFFVFRQPAESAKTPVTLGTPWNDASLESVEIWPVPQPPVIDGDLSDWSEQGLFRSAARGSEGSSHWMEARMRYDATALYIAAKVGDPFPLRSRINPYADPAAGWNGGSVQLRLSVDREKPWPVRADHLEIRRREGRSMTPDDAAGTIVHLTLWHYAPRNLDCLHLAYGMEFDRDKVNPPGYQGMFKPLPDGRGYVVEYAVPWSLLNVEANPPKTGDALALNWVVNWSDESGELPGGQLVDVLNPRRTETRWIFMRAGDWGKAIYR